MPHRGFARDRVIVCDCLTLFLAIVGPVDGAAAVLLPLFIAGGPNGYLGVTTTKEFARARTIVADHARRRPEKFSAKAARLARKQFDFLEADACGNFDVLPHPAIVNLEGKSRDDHLMLLSAAVEWGAGYFSTFNSDLRRMKHFGDVRIRTPRQILDEI